jgi:hypothetical protein
MARRNNNKMTRRSPKLEPVPLTLTFSLAALTGAGIPQIGYIDLSQCASIASRKFLRQGLNWGFAGMKITSASSGTFSVYTLPNTWVMSNAWHKSFAVWQRMNNDALAESESIRPRFLDFKIYADDAHHIAGFGANLLPQAPGGATTAGEWESSKIVIPDTTLGAVGGVQEREFIATGANYPGLGASGFNAVSLIEGYAASRLLPNVLDPNTPVDAADADGVSPENWMSATFNEGTQQDDDVLDLMIAENNIAPYPFENDGVNVDTMYPGGANQMSGLQWHDNTQIYSTSATTNVGISRIKGGNAPCGLLKVVWFPTAEVGNQLLIQIDMIPGTHRGYLAEPMQDM